MRAVGLAGLRGGFGRFGGEGQSVFSACRECEHAARGNGQKARNGRIAFVGSIEDAHDAFEVDEAGAILEIEVGLRDLTLGSGARGLFSR